MNEQELNQKRLFMELYQRLNTVEFAFNTVEESFKTKFSIANNFDLDNPNTYLELITPVSRDLKFLKLALSNARDTLQTYKATEKILANTHQQKQKKTSIKQSVRDSEIKSLEKRIARLEIMMGVIIGLFIGFILIPWLNL